MYTSAIVTSSLNTPHKQAFQTITNSFLFGILPYVRMTMMSSNALQTVQHRDNIYNKTFAHLWELNHKKNHNKEHSV